MRHPHDNPRNLIRQPAWADGFADRLRFSDYSATTPRTLLARGLLLAAATGDTLSHAAPRLLRRGRETIRKGIAANLPDDPRILEDRLAAGLRHTLPRRYRGRPPLLRTSHDSWDGGEPGLRSLASCSSL